MATNRSKAKGALIKHGASLAKIDSSALESFNIIELSHTHSLTNGPAGKALIKEIENAQLNKGIASN